MNPDAGDARKIAAAATSSGVPQRFIGADSTTARCALPSISPLNAVAIQPGASTLTRMRGATDRASDLLNASTPPFTAAYIWGLVPGIPVSTWSQLILIMTPLSSRSSVACQDA